MNMYYSHGIGQVRSFARPSPAWRFALNGHSLTIIYAPKSPGNVVPPLALPPQHLDRGEMGAIVLLSTQRLIATISTAHLSAPRKPVPRPRARQAPTHAARAHHAGGITSHVRQRPSISPVNFSGSYLPRQKALRARARLTRVPRANIILSYTRAHESELFPIFALARPKVMCVALTNIILERCDDRFRGLSIGKRKKNAGVLAYIFQNDARSEPRRFRVSRDRGQTSRFELKADESRDAREQAHVK